MAASMTGTSRYRSLGLLLLALGAACGACTETVCEQAQSRIESCQPELDRARGTSGVNRQPRVSDDCSGKNECIARCLAPASCDAIASLSYGVNITDPNSPPRSIGADFDQVWACVEACSE
jgi:hypothetical protein